MKIAIEEVIDYLKCPMRYKYRYIDKVDELTLPNKIRSGKRGLNHDSAEEIFDREIHKVAYHIFNYVQDERYPSEYLLRQKWGKIWCKNKTVDDLMGETFDIAQKGKRNTIKRLERQGLKAIANLHPHFKEAPGVPILVGRRVEVEVGRHTVSVTLDLVREVRIEEKDIIEVIDFKTGLKMVNPSLQIPNNLHIAHDIEMTAASMGFRKLTGEKEDRIVYYDMIGNQEYITVRDEEHYKTLENVLDNVEKAMNAEIYYPVMNDRCHECPFQVHCNNTNWYKGDEQ